VRHAHCEATYHYSNCYWRCCRSKAESDNKSLRVEEMKRLACHPPYQPPVAAASTVLDAASSSLNHEQLFFFPVQSVVKTSFTLAAAAAAAEDDKLAHDFLKLAPSSLSLSYTHFLL